jgi:hypothetical protein
VPKRLTRADIERIREEVKAWNRGDRGNHTEPATVQMKLSCGHEDGVKPGIDPTKAICGQCRAKAMRSTQG